MEIKIRFLGAAQNVTGSRHLVEVNGIKVLIDCGLYQERQFVDRNWDTFPVAANQIDAVLLTHAHLDHCGLLPKLVKEGFRGKIYGTTATCEIANIILMDSAKLQEEDAEYKNRRHKKEGRDMPEAKPLYTIEDAQQCITHFSAVPYREEIEIGNGVKATLYDAGHVLGSSIIRLKAVDGNEERIIIFSGDIGRPDRPIVCDPTVFEKADYVLIESTYGDRVHQDTADIKSLIAETVNETKARGGNIIVPSFALERSQELLYYINELISEDRIPHLMVFLDSPMASKITKVFSHHPEMFDKDMQQLIAEHGSPFKFAGLKVVEKTAESKAINHIHGTVMVIAGSGMCTGGRVKHHLVNNIGDEKNTIMFVGYQAVGTLGRRIVEGEKRVRILGAKYNVKAKIARIHGFSAHADKNELLAWLKELKEPPRKVFVVHGEMSSANKFAQFVRESTGWDVMVPKYKDEVILD
ncbi:MAG: MBL fold metallo-hydrolase [Phycisphaerae bacterium]|nr:MBL fold metallo-hydrolase [Phycisphaerae bacterium]